MTLETSRRAAAVKPSATIAVSARAAELRAAGRDILSLSMGEPDFPTPRRICQAAIAAIRDGQTRYTAVDGTPELKRAVQEKFRRENGLEYELDEIIATTGAKQAIYNLLLALLNPGDEVLVPAPYWVSYPDMVRLADGEPVILATTADQQFKIQPRQLAGAITPRTRLLLLNSPSNPTGKTYRRDEYRALAEVLQEHPRIAILSDEIYEHIYWGDEPYSSFAAACPELRDRTLLVNGVSKAYAMTGWRLGYAAGPAPWIRQMRKIQGQSTSNPCSIAQAAAVAALNGEQDTVRKMNRAFHRRHDRFIPALAALPGLDCAPTDGAFYAFPAIGEALAARPGLGDDVAFANWLLDTAGVAAVPGSAFGMPGHLRLSYAAADEVLDEALIRLRRALNG